MRLRRVHSEIRYSGRISDCPVSREKDTYIHKFKLSLDPKNFHRSLTGSRVEAHRMTHGCIERQKKMGDSGSAITLLLKITSRDGGAITPKLSDIFLSQQ